MPIKSKQAEEIAEKLLEYIAIFGPPKIILSDQGIEFNNKIVNSLITAVGTEHRITSAYHPRTNGQTERFNFVFIEALRKYTESNNNDWPKWIPFVLLDFRSRVHSTTGYTPFELMFGRRMNKFDDYTINDRTIEDQVALVRRTEEIRRLIEGEQAQAVENIKNKQVIQKETQNKRENITEVALESGTKVYIKVMEMQDKLQPRYRGPFTIKERTIKGNYIVENSVGEVMYDTYPLSRLKVIENNAEKGNFFKIEKILGYRIKNHKHEYLVKWLGCSDKENSWEIYENFVDPTKFA